MKKHFSKVIFIIATVLAFAIPAWGASLTQTLQGGDTLAVTCNGQRLDQHKDSNTQRTLTCVPNSTTTTRSTSTTSSTSTSSTSTTSTTSTSTTTTILGDTTACGIVNPAFCDTFNSPQNGGTQTGDLNPLIWGVSRVGNVNPSQGLVWGHATSHNFCAGGAASPIPNDVRICNGQMVEALNDGDGVVNLDTYPKQPFNFAGRTGIVKFDVSADSGGSHAAWPEFFITDEPVPGLRSQNGGSFVPGISARNQIGFSLAGCNFGGGTLTGINQIFTTINGVEQGSGVPMTTVNCITKGSRTAMNHIEVRVSTSRIEIWGTDAGSTTLKQLAFADNLNLAFSQGLVWLSDVHYNAIKACEIDGCPEGAQTDHNFFWDNLGFDGPKTYRDWGFDVPYSLTPGIVFAGFQLTNIGYVVGTGPKTLTINNVDKGAATGAKVVGNFNQWSDTTWTVSVNGHAPVAHTAGSFEINTFSFPIPLSDIVNGTNTLTFTSGDGNASLANVSLIMVAAAPVP